MPPSNQLWYLMARSLSGETTMEEEQELMGLLENDFSLQQQYDLLKRLWKKTENEIPGTGNILKNSDKNISRILQLAASTAIQPEKGLPPAYFRRRRSKILYFTGAVTMLILAIIFIPWQRTPGKNIYLAANTQMLAAQNGSRSKTILPDGSTVWLNAGSKIYYNKDFNGKFREIKLEGEAFFDVQKNPQKPFIVHTSGIDIKVLGTAFNVKSYPSDKNVETTLLRGLVQVTRDNDVAQKPIFLHPNEKIIISKKSLAEAEDLAEKMPLNSSRSIPIVFKITHLDSTSNKGEPVETAWINNRLIFRGDNFEELAVKLERWYNVSIVFENEKTKQLNFTGSFETETVEQAFAALKTAATFNYTMKENNIFISP